MALANHHEWTDLWGKVEVVVPLEVRRLVKAASIAAADRSEGDDDAQRWLATWRDAATRVDRVLDQHSRDEKLDHVTTAEEIWGQAEGTDLWLGASNAVRAFDIAARAPGRASVFANRGLAGIDGSIASALGVQAMRHRPMRVVVGDLTFCYDLPTLAARPDYDPDIQVIVLDDRGGSIFASLEHGSAPEELYEKYFAVAQRIDIPAAARACGWEAVTVATVGELRGALAVPIVGRSVIHVPLERPTEVFAALRGRAI